MFEYQHLVFAGTFDHFHVGHQKMIDQAFKLAHFVSLGIATKKLCNEKILSSKIQPFAKRKKIIEKYLHENKYSNRAKLFPLSDIYGSSVTDYSIDAILVTKNTKHNAEKINEIRLKNGLKLLKIITSPLFLADDGKEISSERIRLGEISPSGHSYSHDFSSSKTLHLPVSLRESLRKPLGKINNGELAGPMIITVGDIVSSSLLKIGIDPAIKIIDNKTRREKIKHKEKELTIANRHEIRNNPGEINLNFFNIFRNLRDDHLKNGRSQLLVVCGEEDLLVLPAVLLAPLSSIVLYGHFQFGVVLVGVTERKKRQVEKIMNKFIRNDFSNGAIEQ